MWAGLRRSPQLADRDALPRPAPAGAMALPPIRGGAVGSPLGASGDKSYLKQRRRPVPVIEKGSAPDAPEADVHIDLVDKGPEHKRRMSQTGKRKAPTKGKARAPGDTQKGSPRARRNSLKDSTAGPFVKEATLRRRPRGAHKSLPPELEKRAKDLFYEFDYDGNGQIDASELRSVMKTLGHELTPKEVQSMLDRVDRNKSGAVDLREFMDYLAEVNSTGHDAAKRRFGDESNVRHLVAAVSLEGQAKDDVGDDTKVDGSALQKILSEDFDLHDFRIEEVLPGPITFNSLQVFLLDGKA